MGRALRGALSAEPPITGFLARVTRAWLAYASEGMSLAPEVHQIARAHGVRVRLDLQAEAAVLSVEEGERAETVTVTVVADQQVTRLDRLTRLRAVVVRAKQPGADLAALSRELDTIGSSPSPYPASARGLGIVLFALGFSVSAQAT